MRGCSRSATGCKVVMARGQSVNTAAGLAGVSRRSAGSVKTLAVATPVPGTQPIVRHRERHREQALTYAARQRWLAEHKEWHIGTDGGRHLLQSFARLPKPHSWLRPSNVVAASELPPPRPSPAESFVDANVDAKLPTPVAARKARRAAAITRSPHPVPAAAPAGARRRRRGASASRCRPDQSAQTRFRAGDNRQHGGR